MSDLFFCFGYDSSKDASVARRKGVKIMSFCYVRKRCLVIHLPKEIDHCQAEVIKQECDVMFLKSLVRDVIFDFTNTVFMDSSGIGLILGRIQQVQPINGQVFLFGGSPSMKKMWKMSGILKKVKILNTIEEVKEVYE